MRDGTTHDDFKTNKPLLREARLIDLAGQAFGRVKPDGEWAFEK